MTLLHDFFSRSLSGAERLAKLHTYIPRTTQYSISIHSILEENMLRHFLPRRLSSILRTIKTTSSKPTITITPTIQFLHPAHFTTDATSSTTTPPSNRKELRDQLRTEINAATKYISLGLGYPRSSQSESASTQVPVDTSQPNHFTCNTCQKQLPSSSFSRRQQREESKRKIWKRMYQQQSNLLFVPYHMNCFECTNNNQIKRKSKILFTI